MTDITLVLLCAGNSSRFELKTKKQWLRCDTKPLWLYVANKLMSYYKFDNVIITSHNDEIRYMKNFTNNYTIINGGDTRQQSIKNSLEYVDTKYVMITDVARCCIPKNIILDLIANKDKADCVVPFLQISDTVVYEDITINRDELKVIQTPQLSNTQILKEAVNINKEFTDDSSAIKNINGTIFYIQGDGRSKKLTFNNDLEEIKCLVPPSKDVFVGNGFDIHPFEDNKKMYLGGIKLDCKYGFKAHSDGDVLIHSLIDALLGAAGAGDIGEFFPDTNSEYKDISSVMLLERILQFVENIGFQIVNIDLTIIAEQPKINKYKQQIKLNLASIINIEPYLINIKATTAEKLGFIGRKEGLAVQSSVMLKFYDWTKE